MLERLADETFDVLVVGGGVTGVGVALDAATRGLRTALVEADDFASGTSSKSSKLVHGGLRYLQQGDVRLVYEALHERQRLRRNAPHLVKLLPFLIPILTKDGLIPRRVARALGSAMWMYDLTGGLRIGKLHKRLDADEAFAHLPTMPRERLAGGYLYYDATADDARLVLTIARTAADHGAVVANRCRVVALTKDGRASVDGATVDVGDRAFDVRAHVVVNAAGVWADEVRTLEDGVDPDSIRPAKGVHITVPWDKVRNDIAVVIPVRGTSAACSSCRGDRSATARSATPTSAPPTPTTTARSTTRRAPPTTSPTCCARSTTPSRPASRPTTSPACGPGCGRSSSRRRAAGPPTCRGATG